MFRKKVDWLHVACLLMLIVFAVGPILVLVNDAVFWPFTIVYFLILMLIVFSGVTSLLPKYQYCYGTRLCTNVVPVIITLVIWYGIVVYVYILLHKRDARRQDRYAPPPAQ